MAQMQCSLCLSANIEASLLQKIVHFLPIPPDVEKTSGVKTPGSMSRTRWPYSLFLSDSCSL